MTKKLMINGFGRMGRLALRQQYTSGTHQVVHINDPNGTPELAAHLLKYDSTHGTWAESVKNKKTELCINTQTIKWSSELSIETIPLNKTQPDIVIDCSGKNRTLASLAPYFDQGVKKVIVSAPLPDPKVKNIVFGINDHLYNPKTDHVITAASCTTNALAPVVQAIHTHFNIKQGSITTLHNPTNTQLVVDGFHNDLRRARSSMTSLIPTSTGSAFAIEKIFPELKDRLSSIAIRVPVLNASLIDCVFEVEKKTSPQSVNAQLYAESESNLKGVLGYEARPLVSSDFLGSSYSSIIDAGSTTVTNKTQLKILSWYDNEWGYVCRLMDLVNKVASELD